MPAALPMQCVQAFIRNPGGVLFWPGSRDMTSDSLIGVRDCGCVTAWMAVKNATPKEIRDFYAEMARSGREVRKANLIDVHDKIGRCSCHGEAG